MADSHLVNQKNYKKNKADQKYYRIVGQMWLGILSDLPLLYQTCPVGPTLFGKTDVFNPVSARTVFIRQNLRSVRLSNSCTPITFNMKQY